MPGKNIRLYFIRHANFCSVGQGILPTQRHCFNAAMQVLHCYIRGILTCLNDGVYLMSITLHSSQDGIASNFSQYLLICKVYACCPLMNIMHFSNVTFPEHSSVGKATYSSNILMCSWKLCYFSWNILKTPTSKSWYGM